MNSRFFLKNTISNYAVILLKIMVGIWSLPIYLEVFGKTNYAMFALAIELPQILSFLDFGSSKAILRYSAKYRNDRILESYEFALNTNITIGLFTAMICGIIIVLLGINSIHIYQISSESYEVSLLLFLTSAVSCSIIFIGLIPQNILIGNSVFHERNKFQLTSIAYTILLLIAVKQLRPTINTFAFFYVLNYLIVLSTDLFLVRKLKLLKEVKIRLVNVKTVVESEHFKYNASLFFLSIVAIFSSALDKQMIAIILGVPTVTTYVVITKPYYLLKSFFSNFHTVIKPTIAAPDLQQTGYINRVILVTSHFSVLSFILMSLYILSLWPTLSTIWLKTSEYSQYSFYVAISLINLSLSAFTALIIQYFILSGQPKTVLKLDVVSVVLNVFVSIILCINFGVIGVIIGTTVQMVVNVVLFINVAVRQKIVDLKDFFSKYFLLTILFLLFCFVVIYMNPKINDMHLILCGLCTVFVIFYFHSIGIIRQIKTALR